MFVARTKTSKCILTKNRNPLNKFCEGDGVGSCHGKLGAKGGGLGAVVNTERIGLLQHPS